jgi:hypothetical protein
MKRAMILGLVGLVFFGCLTTGNAGADKILINPNASKLERKLYEFGQTIPQESDVLTIVADGYAAAGGGLRDENGHDIKPDDFARIILRNSIVKSNYRQIKLYACNIAQGDYLQKVVDSPIFRGKCIQIVAPNAFVFVFKDADGKYGFKLCRAPDNDAGTSCKHPGGEWITFNSTNCHPTPAPTSTILREWLLQFKLEPWDLHGGSHLKATVELSADAPADGVLVTLMSNHPECVLSAPPTLIPAGKRKAVIDIATRFVDADTNFRIVASTSLGTDTMEDYGTVRASKLIDLLVPETVQANTNGNVGKIVLDGPGGPNTRVDFGPDSHRKPTPFRHIPEFVTVPYGATEVEFKYDTSELPDGTEYQSDAMYPNLNGTVLARGIKVQR